MSIVLSNGHILKYVVASGALGFDGKGWPWERPLVKVGLIKPELFTVVTKTLTRFPRQGNYREWNPFTWLPLSPWSCIRFIPGGSINKVGLTNPGIKWWCREVAPAIDFEKSSLVGSIYGDDREEWVEMAEMLNPFNFVGLELDSSCLNTGRPIPDTETVVGNTKAVKRVSRHPLFVKISVAQDYLRISHGLEGVAEVIELNSVPWEMRFPEEKSPLWRLEEKFGGGGGGISGRPAQGLNWSAANELTKQGAIPVAWPSVMSWKDVKSVQEAGARVVSFGAIHLRTPWRPTVIVKKENSHKDIGTGTGLRSLLV